MPLCRTRARCARCAAAFLAAAAVPAMAGLVQGAISGLQPGTTPGLYRSSSAGPVKVGDIPVQPSGRYSISLEAGQYEVQLSCPDPQNGAKTIIKTVTMLALDSPVVRNFAC
jgi:hypothetical protein